MPTVTYIPADSARPEVTLITPAIKSSKDKAPSDGKSNIFYEYDGYVSIYANHYTKAINGNNIYWKTIAGIGRDGDGVTSFPVTTSPGNNSELSLEYEFYTYDSGSLKLNACFSPTLNLHNTDGLKYSITIDDEQPQIVSINKDDNDKKTWEQWVANNIIIKTTNHKLTKPGKHVLKYSVLDPAIILQKLVVDFGGVKQSYLGPPETNINKIDK